MAKGKKGPRLASVSQLIKTPPSTDPQTCGNEVPMSDEQLKKLFVVLQKYTAVYDELGAACAKLKAEAEALAGKIQALEAAQYALVAALPADIRQAYLEALRTAR